VKSNKSSKHSSARQPESQSKHPFLHELHCIGSLHSVLKQFQETTGWTLTYHCADSVPAFLQSKEWMKEKVSTQSKNGNQEILTPEILAEMDRNEECWLPIDIHSEFQNLVQFSAKESDSVKDSVSPSLRFLLQPIGFLHLSRRKNIPTVKNPKIPSFSCVQFHSFKSNPSNPVLGVGKEISFEEVRRGAIAIRDMVAEMQIIRIHLWLLEMNAAANAPILEKTLSIHNEFFAGNFRKLLEFIAETLNLAAIGIYLFDARHQQFKLRAHVGLSMDSYLQMGRKLPNAQADLRAYEHEHIVLHDASIPENLQFQMPEAFESGVCMPLRTDRSKFGTVWFFSNQKFFSEATIQQCQLNAELLALSLEREAFLRRYGRSMEYRSELKKASDLQTIQAPIQVPGRRNYVLKGRICSAPTVRNPYKNSQKSSNSLNEEIVSGDFYDWFTLPNGQTLVALGSMGIRGIAGAILAATVRSTLRSHAQYQISAAEILAKVHETIWNQLAASARISLFCGILHQESRYLALHFAHLGILRALRVDGNSFSKVSLTAEETSGFLGSSSDFHCYVDSLYLNPGESLAIFNDGLESNIELFQGNEQIVWDKIPQKTSPDSTEWGHAPESFDSPAETKIGKSVSQKLATLVFDVNDSVSRKKSLVSRKLEMMEQIVDIELGKSFCEKQYPTANLLALQAKNYFEKFVTKTKSDQSVLVIQHLARRKAQGEKKAE